MFDIGSDILCPMPSRREIRTIIATLEKQRAELKEIISALRQIADHPSGPVPDLSLNDHEKRLVEEALHRTAGNQTHAANVLKISRDTMRYKMAKHGLKPKR